MTLGKRIGIILGTVLLIGALIFAASQIIAPSAKQISLTGTDTTVTGFIKTPESSKGSQKDYKYALQSIGITYYLTPATEAVTNFLQNNLNQPQAVVIKGKQQTVGLPSYEAIIVTDAAKQPNGEAFSGTGTLTLQNNDAEFPLRFVANGKEYVANVNATASFDPASLATEGDVVQVTGYVYTFDFLRGTQLQLVINDASIVAHSNQSNSTITIVPTPTPTSSPAILDNSISQTKINLTSITPISGKASGEITLKGSGFDEYYNTIKFNDVIVAVIAPIDATTLKFSIPTKTCSQPSDTTRCQDASLKAGDYRVTVSDTANQLSNELTYTVK